MLLYWIFSTDRTTFWYQILQEIINTYEFVTSNGSRIWSLLKKAGYHPNSLYNQNNLNQNEQHDWNKYIIESQNQTLK